MSVRAVFFDAGNTLLFASRERTLAPLATRGLFPSQDALYAAERAAKHLQDGAIGKGGSVDRGFWDCYYAHLLEDLGCPDEALRAALVCEIRKAANWDSVMPGTRTALEALRQQFRLGVISNSDGTIRKAFQAVGLADCFETFVDSGLIGFEKPDPRIFRAALESLQTPPGEALYVGDVYSIDYLGATRVGMQAVLLDVSGAYREKAVPRVESLAGLASFLQPRDPSERRSPTAGRAGTSEP